MIYTIGYDHMTTMDLLAAMAALQVERLIDVRSIPHSRMRGWGNHQVRVALGPKYHWAGAGLGGRGDGPTTAAVEALSKTPYATRVMLMCKEEAPGDCHRHHGIAVPLYQIHGVDCVHVFQDHLILASELQASFDQHRDYECESAPWA